MTVASHPITRRSREDDVVSGLRAGVDYVVGVPDSSLASIIAELAREPGLLPAPREDVAVAMAVGARLAGRRPLVFMKNAGLATALDAVGSLALASGVGLALLVGWAGTGLDRLAHHVVVGRSTEALLRSFDLSYLSATRGHPVDEEDVRDFVSGGFTANEVRALLFAA
jgi:sulfopyruvate decarboxylase TPP-binding subunit